MRNAGSMRRSLLILSLLLTAPSFALGQVGGKSGAGAPDDAKSLLKRMEVYCHSFNSDFRVVKLSCRQIKVSQSNGSR
jgi:hypothetical protein